MVDISFTIIVATVIMVSIWAIYKVFTINTTQTN